MTERELLELAAVAAGVEHKGWCGPAGLVLFEDDDVLELWNPLTDGGDAVRLAVKCNLQVNPGDETNRFVVVIGAHGQILEERRPDGDAATRRAITRAAAEIGKAMKEGHV